MPQPGFETLRQRLLCAGVAPRHVNRYVGELRDHFDDLVREELAHGRDRASAESEARLRLGDESVLAEGMLERPEMRSFVARYPWAMFVLGPITMLVGALAATIAIEAAVLTLIGHVYRNPGHLPPPEWFMTGIGLWNSLPSIIAPLAIAGVIYLIGSRQRIRAGWVFAGVAIVCVLGAFQQVSFTDNGHHGELSFAFGLLPPFPHALIVSGAKRAIANLAVVALTALTASRLGLLRLARA